jgi:hypothetical protein
LQSGKVVNARFVRANAPVHDLLRRVRVSFAGALYVAAQHGAFVFARNAQRRLADISFAGISPALLQPAISQPCFQILIGAQSLARANA